MTKFDAHAHVEQLIEGHPIVFFATQGCGYCRTVFNIFEQCKIAHHLALLDAREYQQDHRGRQVRAALLDITGSHTVPQIFINGQFIGGCTDMIAMARNGRLGKRLQEAGVSWRGSDAAEPYEIQPCWMRTRP